MPEVRPPSNYSCALRAPVQSPGKDQRRSRTFEALLLALVSLFFACASAKPPFAHIGPEPENPADRAMARFADLYLDQALALRPVQASATGSRKWDRMLPDWSKSGVDRSRARLRELERELARIDENKLSVPYAIDHELVEADIAKELFILEDLRPFAWDVPQYVETLGAAFFYLADPADDPSTARGRLEAILDRMAAVPSFLGTARKNLESPSRFSTEAAIALIAEQLASIESELPKLFSGDPALKARFDLEQPKVSAALRSFSHFLETDLLARSKGDFRLGRKNFDAKLARVLGSTATSESLAGEAERALETTRLEMYDLAIGLHAELFPGDRAYATLTGDERTNAVIGRVLAKLSADHGTPESLLEDVRDAATKAKARMAGQQLIDLPPHLEPLSIEPTPSNLETVRAIFFYPPAAYKNVRKASLFVPNLARVGGDEASFLLEYNKHALRALMAHEAYPGHYIQHALAEASPGASIVKRVFASTPMAEGWACLAEDLLEEGSVAPDDRKPRLFYLKGRLRVFANALLDVQVHTSAMDEKALDAWALDLLQKKAFLDEVEATRRLRRAKLTSTELSAYFVGYKEMRDLYDSAKQKQKSAFVRRAFLAELLSYGTVPPRLVRRQLEAQGKL